MKISWDNGFLGLSLSWLPRSFGLGGGEVEKGEDDGRKVSVRMCAKEKG